jgi:hypothetical protein
MKKQIFQTLFLIFVFAIQSTAQDNQKTNQDIDKILTQINDSLPTGWHAKTDTASSDEISIQSGIIELTGSMFSNDPPVLNGHCEITIQIVTRISPDSITAVRKRNKELRDNLPPQDSKDNLKNWNEQNAETLKILDAEPTHYNNKYSYRITCNRLPKNEKDLADYNKIMGFINRKFSKYPD